MAAVLVFPFLLEACGVGALVIKASSRSLGSRARVSIFGRRACRKHSGAQRRTQVAEEHFVNLRHGQNSLGFCGAGYWHIAVVVPAPLTELFNATVLFRVDLKATQQFFRRTAPTVERSAAQGREYHGPVRSVYDLPGDGLRYALRYS